MFKKGFFVVNDEEALFFGIGELGKGGIGELEKGGKGELGNWVDPFLRSCIVPLL